jgi:hypothetical protein
VIQCGADAHIGEASGSSPTKPMSSPTKPNIFDGMQRDMSAGEPFPALPSLRPLICPSVPVYDAIGKAFTGSSSEWSKLYSTYSNGTTASLEPGTVVTIAARLYRRMVEGSGLAGTISFNLHSVLVLAEAGADADFELTPGMPTQESSVLTPEQLRVSRDVVLPQNRASSGVKRSMSFGASLNVKPI